MESWSELKCKICLIFKVFNIAAFHLGKKKCSKCFSYLAHIFDFFSISAVETVVKMNKSSTNELSSNDKNSISAFIATEFRETIAE